jgi:hypothetical protein
MAVLRTAVSVAVAIADPPEGIEGILDVDGM